MIDKKANSSVDMRVIKSVYGGNIDRFYDDMKTLSKRHGVGVWDAVKKDEHRVSRGLQTSQYNLERDKVTSKRLEYIDEMIRPKNKKLKRNAVLAGGALGALLGVAAEQPKGKAQDLGAIGKSTAIGGLKGATAGALMAALISKKPDKEYRKRYREPVHFFKDRNHLENFVPNPSDDGVY